MGQSFPVVIDPQLEHLKLNDIVKAPIRGEIAKYFNVKTAIKNEPGLLSSTVNNLLLDDGDEEVHTYLCNNFNQTVFMENKLKILSKFCFHKQINLFFVNPGTQIQIMATTSCPT